MLYDDGHHLAPLRVFVPLGGRSPIRGAGVNSAGDCLLALWSHVLLTIPCVRGERGSRKLALTEQLCQPNWGGSR